MLIDVDAFALNYGDFELFTGDYTFTLELPARFGDECSGRIIGLGPEVTNFKIGDRVSTMPIMYGKNGVNGEVALYDSRYCAPVPDNISPARLPNPKPTTINLKDSHHERGTTRGQVKPDRLRSAPLERDRHWARTNGASMAHHTRASSGSCRSVCSVCSWPPAITLDSRDESLTGFVQQGPIPVVYQSGHLSEPKSGS
jgi:Alcohol dehydrogenase GroES-like domain